MAVLASPRRNIEEGRKLGTARSNQEIIRGATQRGEKVSKNWSRGALDELKYLE